ncbi:MAG: TetR family transcriptional regulator [Flavobacteriaceae bacterium]|nr:TetR family transcriptional regulator [Flavobacteriaceae bacterium]
MQKKFNSKQIHILNIAEELIAKNGFKDTSVREISSKAKVNVAMISYYFGSKEKMMNALYEYRVQRSKQKFSEFTQTIINGRPDMQLKEIINFIVSEILKYKHFHGFVTQEMQHSESTRELLTDFYLVSTEIIQKIIAKGISIGIFKKAAKAEDLISTIIGTLLFTIRNKAFYAKFLNCSTDELPFNIEDKVKTHLQQCTFSLLGYDGH